MTDPRLPALSADQMRKGDRSPAHGADQMRKGDRSPVLSRGQIREVDRPPALSRDQMRKVDRPPVLSRDQMREVDRLMVEEYGISIEQMMENAGRNLADLTLEILGREGRSSPTPRIIIACGAGNNGGGGMVAARFLSNRGLEVTAVLAGRESDLKPAPARAWKTLQQLSLRTIVASSSDPLGLFKSADLIIDALIGYGLRREPRGIPARVMGEILNSGHPNLLALDVPSGLDCDDGSAAETCIRARATMTLALPKTGLFVPQARGYVGDLYLADIGVPPSLYTHLGLESQPLFTAETIIRLNPNQP